MVPGFKTSSPKENHPQPSTLVINGSTSIGSTTSYVDMQNATFASTDVPQQQDSHDVPSIAIPINSNVNGSAPNASQQPSASSSADIVRRPSRSHPKHPRKIKCTLCPKEFRYHCRLNSHTREKHMGNQYSCDKCDKTFHSPTGLRLHKKTHDGIYKHICEFCGKGFNYRSELISHRNREQNIRSYECAKCNKRFFFFVESRFSFQNMSGKW